VVKEALISKDSMFIRSEMQEYNVIKDLKTGKIRLSANEAVFAKFEVEKAVIHGNNILVPFIVLNDNGIPINKNPIRISDAKILIDSSSLFSKLLPN
jgi:hypothetical protein